MTIDRRWMGVAVLLSLFLSGVAVGAVAVLLVRDPAPVERQLTAPDLGDRPFPRPAATPGEGFGGPPGGPPAFVAERVVERMARELDLGPEQTDSVEVILRRQRDAAWEELSEVAPRLRASVDSAAAQIRRVLTSEQRARFDEMGGLATPPFARGRPGAPR